MADFSLKRGASKRSISSTLTSSNSTDDLSTATAVTFTMRNRSTGQVIINNAAAILVAAAATYIQVRYDWANPDVANSALFDAEWKVTFSGGKYDIFPSVGTNTVEITPSLA